MPDPSHGAKKAINNLESSTHFPHAKRCMFLPRLLVDTIIDAVPQLLPRQQPEQMPPEGLDCLGPGEDSRGEEVYLYVMRRIYDLMNSYSPYSAGVLEGGGSVSRGALSMLTGGGLRRDREGVGLY